MDWAFFFPLRCSDAVDLAPALPMDFPVGDIELNLEIDVIALRHSSSVSILLWACFFVFAPILPGIGCGVLYFSDLDESDQKYIVAFVIASGLLSVALFLIPLSASWYRKRTNTNRPPIVRLNSSTGVVELPDCGEAYPVSDIIGVEYARWISRADHPDHRWHPDQHPISSCSIRLQSEGDSEVRRVSLVLGSMTSRPIKRFAEALSTRIGVPLIQVRPIGKNRTDSADLPNIMTHVNRKHARAAGHSRWEDQIKDNPE